MWLVGGGGRDRFLSDVPFPAPNPAIHPGNSWLLLSLELYFPPLPPGGSEKGNRKGTETIN